MGRVTTGATIESLEDLWAVERGTLPAEQVRRVVLTEALVDTGATILSLPTRMIQELGLMKSGQRRVMTSAGPKQSNIYQTVRLTIMGRNCPVDVLEVPDEVPVLIGQIPLEALDLVIDLRGRKLIGNPAHDGELVYEMY